MGAYFSQFFQAEYWFGFPRVLSTGWLVAFLFLFGAFFFGGLAALMLYPKIQDRWKRQVVRHSGSGAVWIGVCGLLLVGARVEFIPFFMTRFWFIILGVCSIIWIVRVYRYAVRRKEKLEEETKIYQTKQKYLRS